MTIKLAVWEVKKINNTDLGIASVEFLEEDGFHKAVVKWDGCIHLWEYNDSDHPEEGGDYQHICDIDEQIELLQSLKKAALEQYNSRGEDWPSC